MNMGGSSMSMGGGQSMPPRPQIPREVLNDLGTNDLKSLLADALKQHPITDIPSNSQVEDDEMVYKAEVAENDSDVEQEVETHTEPEESSEPISPEPAETEPKQKKEINPKELENILKGNQW
jgi:hypothetical protein